MGFIFCAYFWRTPMDGHSVREGGSGKNLSFLNSINRRCRYESKGNIGLHRVQTAQLQHKENKKNDPDRLEMNKYCKFCKKHTLHRETK